MAKYQYTLDCYFPIAPANYLGIMSRLEMTIPCINCQRYNRTILFKGLDTPGICTPSSKCSGFPGRWTKALIKELEEAIILRYIVEFEYEPFIDLKHKKPSNLDQGHWARITLRYKCEACGKTKRYFTQDNLGRPRILTCSCGHEKCMEPENPLRYRMELLE